MANVQLENGFTKIANELLEVIQDYKFTTNQLKIIMVVWRKTYGWQTKDSEISLTYFQNATHLSRSRVNESLKELISCKVIIEIKKGGSNGKGKVITFNKNYDEWTIPKYTSASVQNGTRCSVQNGTTGSVQDGTQKRKKESIKKKRYMDLSIHGNGFVNIYLSHFNHRFSKDHKKVTEENLIFILDQLNKIADQIDVEIFEEIVIHHFDNLPSKNDGNILAFIPAMQRYLNQINS